MLAIVHTHFSITKSIIKPKDLVKNAKEKGYTSIAVCDYMTLAAAVPFIKACKEEGIKPIMGLHVVVEGDDFYVLAKNKTGWGELLRLVSLCHDVSPPCLTYQQFDLLVGDNEFLVVVSNHNSEAADQWTPQEVDAVFPYYLNQEDAVDHRLLACIGMKTTLKKANVAVYQTNNEFYIPFFEGNDHYLPECAGPNKIEHMFEEYEVTNPPQLPHFKCPEGMTEADYLKHLCRKGWKEVLVPTGVVDTKEAEDIYKDRILHELNVIEDADISGYFLIVADLINEFKSRGYLIGPGRGSAAGCLVSYLIGITLIDPIEYNLLFERFYDESRKGSLPDVDIDFPPECREEVIEYLKEQYGEKRVCQMATFGRLQGRSALSAVIVKNDIATFHQAKEITKNLPKEDKISDKLAETDHGSVIRWTLENEPQRLADYCYMDDQGNLKGDYARLFEQALRIEGTFQSMGKHAAGVIVCNQDLVNILPLIRETKGGEKLGGAEMGDIEAVGGVKIDVLGIAIFSKITGVCKEL